MTTPARQADWADEWVIKLERRMGCYGYRADILALVRAAGLRAAERAAAIAERDVDWSQFGKRDLEPWEGGKDSVRDYRLGIVTGRAIAMAIRQETTIRSLPADPAATQDGGK